MTKHKALKAVSHRDSLAKTVKLLVRQSGINVQFRGHQPHVVAQGNKAIALVLPELNDNASPDLLEAIQGYLDHEVGHILYTPFAKAIRAGNTNPKAPSLLNIVEDIRLEKLLPQDLPGTKENLERMYGKFIPLMINPGVQQAVASGDASQAFAAVMVPAMRALAGQKQFQTYMDDNALWPHFMILIKRMPDMSKRLRAMQTYDDVEAIVKDMLEAMKGTVEEASPPPPPPPMQPKPLPSDDDDKGDDDDDKGDDDKGDDEDDGGVGHDDGEGEDDGEDEEGGPSRGDQPGDESGEGDDKDKDDTPKEDKNSGRGKSKVSITDALKQLEPTQRTALFEYKKNKKTVSEIANQLNKSEEQVGDLLRSARRRLTEIMKGDR